MANHSHKKRWPLVPPTIPSLQLLSGNDALQVMFSPHSGGHPMSATSTEDID